MNKLAVLISAIALCVCAQTAFAQIDEPSFGENMEVHFKMNTFENEDITFYVFRSDENEPSLEKCVYYEQGKTDDNGNFSADFVLNIPSSDCVAVLSSRRHEQFERLNFYYVNKKHLENTISDINKADSSAALGAVLENAWSEIGADSELIGKVSDKNSLYSGIFNELTEEITNDKLDYLCKLIQNQAVCVLANEGSLSELKPYAADMGLESSAVWNDYVATDVEKSVLAALKGSSPKNSADFLKKFEERAVVRLICCGDVNKTKAFIEKYKAAAGLEDKLSEIEKLTDKQQYNVYSSISSDSSAQLYTDLISKTESYIKNAKKSSSAGSGGNGGGGGGGGYIASANKTANTTATTTGENIEKSDNAASFKDLDGCEWAKEAIEKLYEMKVISGRDSQTFAPNDSVTREEFASMLVNALNLSDASAKCDFSDVSEQRWSYSAIASAKKYGIILGSDGKFNPSDKITRQDLSAMVYRALKVADTGVKSVREYKSFIDYSDISDYACEAVEYLYKCGIINGVTEADFMPLSEATRAQSAKILYEIIKSNAD